MKLANITNNFIKEIENYKLITKKTNINNLIKCIFNEINIGYKYYNKIKNSITIETKKINNVKQIPFPSSSSDSFFPHEIENEIKKTTNYYITCNVTIMDVKFKIIFVFTLNTFNINEYLSIIVTWLHIVLNHSSRDCSKRITMYIYLTKKMKRLPSNETEILSGINVNSAYTYCCGNPHTENEIVIFRKEEWIKSIFHETIHAFGLDFCMLDNENVAERIKKIFPINSEININETYCEFWAETFNVFMISYFFEDNKNNIEKYTEFVNTFIKYEKIFSIVQLIKILQYMNLDYTDLYSKDSISEFKRNSFYHEKTSVFSYYITKCILIYNLEDFIKWCIENNINFIDFYKTKTNVDKFIKFITSKYKNKSFIQNIEINQKIFNKFSKNINFYKSTKMSLLEIK